MPDTPDQRPVGSGRWSSRPRIQQDGQTGPSWPCGCPRSNTPHEATGADTADADAERADTGRPHPDIGKRTRGHRMREYRSLDTGRADAGHAADTGRWKRGCGQGGQAHGEHLDILGTTTPLGRRTVLLWAAHAALGGYDGLAVRPPASAGRPAALSGQLLGRSAGGQAAPTAHCSPRNDWVESSWSG
jgi:hypothetical protein